MFTMRCLLLAALVTIVPVSGFWILPCNGPLVVERADPILSPGEPSGHVHTIMGGNGFGFDMTYEDTQASTCSACQVTQDLSNYWVPALYYQAENGTFIDVQQRGGAAIYYLDRATSGDSQNSSGLLAFPEGFRMLAGNSLLRNYSGSIEQQAISYACLGTDGPETHSFPSQNCPGGIRAQVFFPSCWDGVNLDSTDHKSHMAYPSQYNNGVCPPSHPKPFMSIFYEVIWHTEYFADLWYDGHQPFVWSSGDNTGYGYHGDFVSGWHVPTLQQAINECETSGLISDCKVFNFFPDQVSNGCKIPALIDEAVTGVLKALPGCNPVQSGPGIAISASGCGAPTTIGLPENNYVDLTVSKGFEYVGCGTDNAGTRTLDGATFSSDEMTNENCVDYCNGKGFSLAGTEYSTQCFCGNSIQPEQAPIPYLMGNCVMPCGGDSKEICGGGGQISLYRKCSSTCQNAVITLNNKTSSGGPSASHVKPTSGSVASASIKAGLLAPSSGGNSSTLVISPTKASSQPVSSLVIAEQEVPSSFSIIIDGGTPVIRPTKASSQPTSLAIAGQEVPSSFSIVIDGGTPVVSNAASKTTARTSNPTQSPARSSKAKDICTEANRCSSRTATGTKPSLSAAPTAPRALHNATSNHHASGRHSRIHTIAMPRRFH